MPTYRFHMDAVEHGPVELPDNAAAWREAKEFCGQVVRDELQPSRRLELLVMGDKGEAARPFRRGWQISVARLARGSLVVLLSQTGADER